MSACSATAWAGMGGLSAYARVSVSPCLYPAAASIDLHFAGLPVLLGDGYGLIFLYPTAMDEGRIWLLAWLMAGPPVTCTRCCLFTQYCSASRTAGLASAPPEALLFVSNTRYVRPPKKSAAKSGLW